MQKNIKKENKVKFFTINKFLSLFVLFASSQSLWAENSSSINYKNDLRSINNGLFLDTVGEKYSADDFQEMDSAYQDVLALFNDIFDRKYIGSKELLQIRIAQIIKNCKSFDANSRDRFYEKIKKNRLYIIKACLAATTLFSLLAFYNKITGQNAGKVIIGSYFIGFLVDFYLKYKNGYKDLLNLEKFYEKTIKHTASII